MTEPYPRKYPEGYPGQIGADELSVTERLMRDGEWWEVHVTDYRESDDSVEARTIRLIPIDERKEAVSSYRCSFGNVGYLGCPGWGSYSKTEIYHAVMAEAPWSCIEAWGYAWPVDEPSPTFGPTVELYPAPPTDEEIAADIRSRRY